MALPSLVSGHLKSSSNKQVTIILKMRANQGLNLLSSCHPSITPPVLQ